MSYVIVTNERLVHWYEFSAPTLDTRVVNHFKDRKMAQAIAEAAGINGNYRFVRFWRVTASRTSS